MSETQEPSVMDVKADVENQAEERANDRRRIYELEQTVDELLERIEELEARTPEPGDKEYAAMDKSDKATVVREKLYQEATSTNGRAAVEYKDVIRMFDGNPSPSHAYDLMEKAANQDGYQYGESPEGTKRLTVAVDRVERA